MVKVTRNKKPHINIDIDLSKKKTDFLQEIFNADVLEVSYFKKKSITTNVEIKRK